MLFGGVPGSGVPVTLHIWDDSGAVIPGVGLLSMPLTLTANDLALNTISLAASPVPVSSPFRVGIEFSNAGAPSVARDHDGTVPGRNFIFNGSTTWVDATSKGVTGDWIIRATIKPEKVLLTSFE